MNDMGATLRERWNQKTNRVRAYEVIAVGLLFLGLLISITAYKNVRQDERSGDTATFFQATENALKHGDAISQVQASVVDFIFTNDALDTPTATIAKEPGRFFGRVNPIKSRSLFLGHAYYILYPIAVFTALFPVANVIMFFYALAFVGMLLAAYIALRSSNVPIVGALLFCLLVVTHPAWGDGLLFGQFYPDRLFITTGFVLMCFASSEFFAAGRFRTVARVGLIASAILCALIDERGALMGGLFLVSHAFLNWKSFGQDRKLRLGLGIALLTYSVILGRTVVSGNANYGSFLPANIEGLIALVHTPSYPQLVGIFFLVNGALLVLAFFSWRAAMIALLLMLPNILGNIGGAEKVGWSTHYPSFYFPALVWAALVGFKRLNRYVAVRNVRVASYVLTIGLLIFSSVLDPNSYQSYVFNAAQIDHKFPGRFKEQMGLYLIDHQTRDALSAQADDMRAAVPPNVEVSCIETGMTLLYPNRQIEFFPGDIDHARYAVLSASYVAGKLTYGGAISILGATEQIAMMKLVLTRMNADHYDLDHPKLFPAYALAVVERKS